MICSKYVYNFVNSCNFRNPLRSVSTSALGLCSQCSGALPAAPPAMDATTLHTLRF